MESSSSSSFSGSSKRAKAPGSSNEIPHCLVDGCVADLNLCRDYHRRHKVCEVHSKSPRVTIEGREQRFCQQCSRFHSLTEFDEGKRSCRKRLEGHNRRRRKPQPESLIQNPGFLFINQSSFSGPRILSFGDQQILPSSVVPPNAWPGLLKVEHDMVSPYGSNMVEYNQRPDTFPKFPSYNFRGLHDDHHQLHFHESSSSSTLRNHPNFFSEGLNHQGVDRDRALSLLSPAPEATHEFSLNHTGTEPIHTITQPSMVRDYNYHNFSLLHHQFPEESKAANGASSSQYHDGSGSIAQVPEMFQHGEGSSGSGSHQTLSFMWE